MTTLIFLEPSGARKTVTAKTNQSVMQAATAAGVEGIDAECGGSWMCATCHCLVLDAPVNLLEKQPDEADTLEFVSDAGQESSRLTCQIIVTPDLDGTVFKVIGR